MLPLEWIMARRRPKKCKHCGGLLLRVLDWLDSWNDEAINGALPLIWGSAVVMRLIHPEERWQDPVWEQAFHLVRQGREHYTDEARGYEKQSEEGDRQLLKLTEKLKVQIHG